MADQPSKTHIRDHFVGWQCRLRQHAMRQHGGRPPPGARPRATAADGAEIAPAVTVVLVEKAPEDSIAACRHIVGKTHDPARRYQEALRLLSASYYQHPASFSDVLTAVFAADSRVADALLAEARCVLEFEQFSQAYRIPCAVTALAPEDPPYQATYWHNHMFNAAMPGTVRILAFTPDWRRATATPPV